MEAEMNRTRSTEIFEEKNPRSTDMKQEHTINMLTTSTSLFTFPYGRNLPRGDLLENTIDYFKYGAPLYQAIISDNFEAARDILEERPELASFAINKAYDTPLHVAASAKYDSKPSEDFVSFLVSLMTMNELKLQNKYYKTALYLAAAAGNVKCAMILVNKNPAMTLIADNHGMLPLYIGAVNGRHNIVRFLYDATLEAMDKFGAPEKWDLFLRQCVEHDLFDVALRIVARHPHLAKDVSALEVLAQKPEALNKVEDNIIKIIINSMLRIIRIKVRHFEKDSDALKLLKIIWRDSTTSIFEYELVYIPIHDKDNEQLAFSRLLFVAAEKGNTRFVVELLRSYPFLIWEVNEKGQTIFHIAVMHCHRGIYNLLYEMGAPKDQIAAIRDNDGNNMLHLVGSASQQGLFKSSMLTPQTLWWFQEVEKMMPPAYTEMKNNLGETPYEVFFKNNSAFIKGSLKWVKDCMLVATLIITVAFAVAFTVPGGYDQNHGIPVFIHRRSFIIFALADAISLFSASASLLVYLSLLSSRYDQRSSFYSLPGKLMTGLVALFISVAAMMVTFSASFFVLYHNALKWVPIVIAIGAVIPIVTFAILHYRFLVDMLPTTYCERLFQPREHMLLQ